LNTTRESQVAVTNVKQHIRYGIERVERFGHEAQTKLTLKEIKRIFSSWRLWIFVASYVLVSLFKNRDSFKQKLTKLAA